MAYNQNNPNGQAAMASSTPVVIASNQSAVPVSLATAPTTPVTGTFWQATQPVSLATNTPTLQSGSTTAVTQPTASNLNATVAIAAAQTLATVTTVGTVTTITNGVKSATNTTGGATSFTLISAASTNATSVKASAGTLYGIYAYNNGAAAAYLKLFNLATAPTVGTSTAVMTIMLPAGGGSNIAIPPQGIAFGTGISYAITGAGTTADTTAVAAAQVFVNGIYA